MDALDKQRWLALSPLLDELLDLPEPARAQRLAEIRAGDAAMAEHLQALLLQDHALRQDDFLQQPAAEALQAGGSPPLLEGAGPRPPDMAGESIGPYVLEREIGQGGMGAVWLARRADGRFEGEVAVKFLKSGLFGKGDIGRFEREGQILARLSHPHIARLLDAGLHHGHQPYLVLEYVNGHPIDRYCHLEGLTIEQRVRLFLDVLAAVAHAHQRLILHRDLKPSNILVDQQGQVKLLDFGIAKLLGDATQPAAATELTQRAGSAFTPQFAAPEQVQQGDVTTATDVYALGVLLYQLLGGRHPTTDDTQAHLERLRAVVELVPKRLSDVAAHQLDPVIARQARLLRGDLDTIVAKALKKKPSERYANAEQFAADLRRWLASEPISARPDSRLYVFDRFVRRHRWGVAAGSAAVLALLGLTTVSVLQAHRAEQAERQAQQRRQEAEDLLSYMLGDFADKLRPVGRLELLDSVGSKALTYLAQDGEASPQERLQRAKALTVIGEVRVNKGNPMEALAPLQAARQLVQGDPPAPELIAAWRKAQGAAAFWVGHVHFRARELPQAAQAMTAYRDAERAWLDADPSNTEALLELSYAFNSLGSILLEQGDLATATRHFKDSIDLKRRALAAQSAGDGKDTATARMDLADSLSWLGTTLLWQGFAGAAERTFSEGAKLIEQVRAQAPADGWAYREAIMRRWRAEALQALDRRADALQEAALSKQMLGELHGRDPANFQWRFNALIGELTHLRLQGSSLPAAARLERLLPLRDRIEAFNQQRPASYTARGIDLWTRWSMLQAGALWDQGRHADAHEVLARAAQDQQPLTDTQDLRIQSTLVEAGRMRMRLATAAESGWTVEARQALCRQEIDKIEKMHTLIRVHQQITQAWVDAQSCLGRGGLETVKTTAQWLVRDRSSDSPI